MPYCPECRSEYREGVKQCTECGAALVAALPPEEEPFPEDDPETEPVLLCRVADSTEAEIIRGALREAGILCIQQIFGPLAGQLALVTDGQAPEDCTRLHVAKNRLAEAQEIVTALRSGPVQWPEGLEPEE